MEGAAGNPSPASSQRLPAHPSNSMLQTDDWTSTSEEGGWQSRESVSPTRSQKHLKSPKEKCQSPVEKHQSPEVKHQSPVEKHQSPEVKHQSPVEKHQSPEVKHQSPVEKHQSPEVKHQSPEVKYQSPEVKHQSPVEKHQSPEVKHQSPEVKHQSPEVKYQSPEVKHQSPEVKYQSPVEKHQSPVEKHQSPVEKHQSPEVKYQSPEVKHQSPVEKHQSPVEKHQGPEVKHQSPEVKHQSPEVKHQSPVEKHQSPEVKHQSPEVKHQSPEVKHQSPEVKHQGPVEKHQSPVEKHQSPEVKHQSPEVKHQSPVEKHQSPEVKHQSPEVKHQGPVEKHQSPEVKYQSPEVKHQSPVEKHQSPEVKHQGPEGGQQSAEEPDQLGVTKHSNHKGILTEIQKPEYSPAKLDQLKPKPLQQKKLGESLPRENQKSEEFPSEHQPNLEQPFPTKPDPQKTVLLHTHQGKPGHPFSPKQEQKPVDSQEHQTQGDLCFKNQRTEEDAPPPLKDLTVSTSTFKQDHKQFEPQISKSKDQQDPKNASLAPLNSKQTPPLPQLNTEQTHPFPHLDTQQATPPADQNNHLSSPSIIHFTHVTTLAPLAPPLTMEVFCDQVRPHTPVSSSGEPKLCGFLQKQGGPLRAWKQRWFTYEEKKNQLFYYRTPQDVTPLGRVELCSATFTYPLKDERGMFHIKTPERTFILKAVTQELMLYWLQQLQVKRWQHRQTSTCQDPTNNNNTTDDFLPMLKSPLGLVGEEAANIPSQRTPLTNMSIKHPLIEIQNSVHSLRKRSSQEWSQSVFHVETNNSTAPPASRTHSEPQTPPSPLPLAEPTGQVTSVESRESPSLFDSQRRRTKTRSSSSMTTLHRDTMSSERTSRLLQEKQMLMEEVKAQKELVWILHKALEASQLEKRTCAEFLAATGEQERLELLRHRERQTADLRGRLEEARAEVESAKRSQAQSEAQVVDLQEHVRLLEEKNNAKQEVIIKLSDQLTTCMSDTPRPSGCGLDSRTFRQLQQQLENLKDDMEAYQTQNRFLNSEIHQLTRLWRTSSEQEKSLMVKCAYLEAGNCQMESRYLNVLRQLQEVKALDPVQQTAIQKMIEDALKGELKSVVKLNVTRDLDEYGFKIIPDYEVEDMKLLAKIQALEIRSHNLLHQEGGEHPLLARWAQYLAGRSDDDHIPSPELKGLLRGGVPQEYRQRVWRWLVRARTRTVREHRPERYQQLCEKSRTSPHPACRQIQLDLHRTLTTNQNFSSPSSPALQQLRRILLAFSWQNPAIGYCQGLNRLAAIALLVLQDEEDTFWCLVAVVETIMPQDYYTKNLVASQADQRVLKDFLVEKLPRLAAHFEDHSIDVSLITFNWFLVVFVESLPSDILLPLWDAFLYEGTKVIFRYALALFKYKEDDILKIRDSVEIYQYLRFFTKTISHSRRLISIAFSDMNPFPGRLLRNRRALHLERLQGELRELEEQQREFVTESAIHKDKELNAVASEDDEEL